VPHHSASLGIAANIFHLSSSKKAFSAFKVQALPALDARVPPQQAIQGTRSNAATCRLPLTITGDLHQRNIVAASSLRRCKPGIQHAKSPATSLGAWEGRRLYVIGAKNLDSRLNPVITNIPARFMNSGIHRNLCARRKRANQWCTVQV
jgi:hypothetical protein